MNLSTWLMIGLGVVVGLLLGGLLHAGWVRRKEEARRRLPAKWPLNPRGLVTTEEQEVWEWLREAFHDHFIMVKTPVLRFTIPRSKDKSEQWQELLNGVYATFTVCTPHGKVVGCVDVPGKRGLSKANRELKERLLSDCDIAYTVVRNSHLPAVHAMRAAFLGEVEVMTKAEEEEILQTRGGDSSFHADLTAFTRQKVQATKEAALKEIKDSEDSERPKISHAAGFNPDGTAAPKSTSKPDRFATQWEDSFTQPDSRPAELD